MLWTVLFVVVGIGVAIYLLVVKRGREFAALANRGVPATATVTRRFRTNAGGAGSMGKRIGFAYTGPDGQRYERFATLTTGRYAEFQEGDALPIYLLPDAPDTSAPAWLVDAAREALAKRGR